MSTILDAVIAAIREETEQPEIAITADTTAAGVPGWDSLAHLRIIFNIEERTGRSVDVDASYAAPDVGALARLVEESA